MRKSGFYAALEAFFTRKETTNGERVKQRLTRIRPVKLRRAKIVKNLFIRK